LIIYTRFVGLTDFSVTSEETMITDLEVTVVGFILIGFVFLLRKILRIILDFFLVCSLNFLCYLMKNLTGQYQDIL
jgi:hypothetical protein